MNVAPPTRPAAWLTVRATIARCAMGLTRWAPSNQATILAVAAGCLLVYGPRWAHGQTQAATSDVSAIAPSFTQQIVIQGAAVFLGVLAGILVQLGFQWCMTKHSEAQRVRNLKFELTLNIAKIDTWLEEAVRWRNAVNGNAIATYFGHFDLSRFVYPTLNEMFMSGLLYKYMNHEDIRHLQVVTSEFSFGWERVLNEDVIAAMKANFVQANAVRVVDVWEAKFQGHKATLERIRNKL